MPSEQQITLLKQFILICKANPDILHDPKLSFYKEYLESLGATIPPPAPKTETKTPSPEPEPEKTKQSEPEPMDEPDDLPPLELDESGVIQPEEDEPLPMGDPSKEVSDDDLEKANEHRDQAMAAFSEGDFKSAVENYTKAIELNPGSAILHAKRAAALLKMSKPMAAIRDCTKAIEINPDSAQGYKFRGRANRLLGKWLEAHKDLAVACKLDYDDTANEWLKEVEPNAKKIQEYNRAKDRKKEERELRERQERVRRAQEANKKAAEEAAKRAAQEPEEDDMDFGPFGAPPGGADSMGKLFSELMTDPEIKEAIEKDPSIIASLSEVMSNPASLMKHMKNPTIMKIISKLGSKMGGAGGMGGMPFGFGAGPGPATGDFGAPSAPEEPASGGSGGGSVPKKAPEPDLD